MKFSSFNQLNGFMLIINTFLPVLFLFIFLFLLQSFLTSISSDACYFLNQASKSYEQINLYTKPSQFKSFHPALIEKRQENRLYKIESECDIDKTMSYLLTNDLYSITKNNIDAELASVGNKLGRVKKTINESIPAFPNINIKPVNLKINFPPKKISFPVRLKMNIGKPINTVIKLVNTLDNKINRALKSLGNSVSNAFTGIVEPEKEKIYLEIQKAGYKQAVLWYMLKEFLLSVKNALGKFYWFFVSFILWIFFSYIIWAYNRIRKGMQLLKS